MCEWNVIQRVTFHGHNLRIDRTSFIQTDRNRKFVSTLWKMSVDFLNYGLWDIEIQIICQSHVKTRTLDKAKLVAFGRCTVRWPTPDIIIFYNIYNTWCHDVTAWCSWQISVCQIYNRGIINCPSPYIDRDLIYLESLNQTAITHDAATVTEHFDSPEGNWNSFRHRLLQVLLFCDFAIYSRYFKILNRHNLAVRGKIQFVPYVAELFRSSLFNFLSILRQTRRM